MNVWIDIQKEIRLATNDVKVLEATDSNHEDVMMSIGVSEKSTLGCIVKYTNGILVHNGWLRIFGGGKSKETESILEWNNIKNQNSNSEMPSPSDFLLVAYDVLGGFFAINAGFLGSDLGNIYYFAPDTLRWENLNMGHTQFFMWCMKGDIQKFYKMFRWKDDQKMVEEVHAGQGISVYPYLWTADKNIENSSKRIIPLKALWGLHMDIGKQIKNLPDGTKVRIQVIK